MVWRACAISASAICARPYQASGGPRPRRRRRRALSPAQRPGLPREPLQHTTLPQPAHQCARHRRPRPVRRVTENNHSTDVVEWTIISHNRGPVEGTRSYDGLATTTEPRASM